MASYHCSVKVGKVGKGLPHAAYISREGKYAAMLSKGSGEKLEYLEHGNMPSWAKHRPLFFWEQADIRERSNGSVYREFELALPRELTNDQRIQLVQEFVHNELGTKFAYSFAIHNPLAALEGKDQPHAHIMFSEREQDGIERDPELFFKRANKKNPERGGCPKSNRFGGSITNAERKDALVKLRKNWADLQNIYLEKYGHTDRVDHRTLKEQGKDRTPEKHLGPKRVKMLSSEELSQIIWRRAAFKIYDAATRELWDLAGVERDIKPLNDECLMHEKNPTSKEGVIPPDKVPESVSRNFKTDAPGQYIDIVSGDLMFVDRGGSMMTLGIEEKTVASMVQLAKEKNWEYITLRGSDEFKRAAWLEAALHGMPVRGYQPDQRDIDLSEKMKAELAVRLREQKISNVEAAIRDTYTNGTNQRLYPVAYAYHQKVREVGKLDMSLNEKNQVLQKYTKALATHLVDGKQVPWPRGFVHDEKTVQMMAQSALEAIKKESGATCVRDRIFDYWEYVGRTNLLIAHGIAPEPEKPVERPKPSAPRR